MGLSVEKVRRSKRKQEIKGIYTEAFVKEDRMPFWMMIAMSYLWHTEFLAFYDGDTLCGFTYMATMGKLTFVMFFAVDEGLRSKGYGGQILSQVQMRHPNNKIMVSIEPCDEDAKDLDQRIKRKQFYGRSGYKESGYLMKLGGKTQEVLIKNGQFNRGQLIRFFMLYSNLTVIPKIWPIDRV
ncbi:MAG: hypothetical protein ACRCTE_05105 [Cellulosilyticaceae bacterium]